MDTSLSTMKRDEVIANTLRLARRSHEVTADLIQHLAVIDKRRLYGPDLPSTFVFCTDKLGFSEDVAYNFIQAARAAQRFPAVLDSVRQGRLHLSGLRLLATHLTSENFEELTAKAAGLSKRKIEELVAAIAPKPSLPDSIRKVPALVETASPAPVASTPPQPALSLFGTPTVPRPSSSNPAPEPRLSESADVRNRLLNHVSGASSAHCAQKQSEPESLLNLPAACASSSAKSDERAPAATPPTARRDIASPASADTFRISFDAKRSVREKLQLAQDLLRHSIPGGDFATIFERALDLLIADVQKKRFGVGAKPRAPRKVETNTETSRPEPRTAPVAIRREVYERDQTCTHTGTDGKRCNSTAWLELDHRSGFAKTRKHSAEDMRLLCHFHNQLAADEMYGVDFMNAHRAREACPSGHTSRGDPNLVPTQLHQ